ncbi:hypothetical protein JB92DRAFT_3149624 [Gautieria morchelliformis]|nr:hypothetical protein JB92DRAFT_3149624 [Gautieria morchelliformis]
MVENSRITLMTLQAVQATLGTQLALNFTGLPFKTVGLKYPDIEPTLRGIGSAPTFFDNPSPRKWFYTISVIVDPGHLTSAGDIRKNGGCYGMCGPDSVVCRRTT